MSKDAEKIWVQARAIIIVEECKTGYSMLIESYRIMCEYMCEYIQITLNPPA